MSTAPIPLNHDQFQKLADRQREIHQKLTGAAAICELLADKFDGNFGASNAALAARGLILDARELAHLVAA